MNDVDYDDFAREQLPGVVRFAAALTGDRQLAQDLVQDALIRAYLKWGRVGATDRPDLYLRKMVVNVYLSWRRRWYERMVRPAANPTVGREATDIDHAGQVTDRAELNALLAGLPRQQRAAIVLRFFEDRDDAEIAEILGCAPVTVRSHISRGLAAMRLLADPAHGRPGRPTNAMVTP